MEMSQPLPLNSNPGGIPSADGLKVQVPFKPGARHLKTALMSYFRFRRQYVAADECDCGCANETCDVLVLDKEGYAIDVEVKISKADLWTGEGRKKKHGIYKSSSENGPTNTPNFFYVCVPSELIDEAKKWVKEINPKYGIIEFLTSSYPPYGRGWEHMTSIRKQAKILHDKINVKWNRILLKRLSSAMCGVYQNQCSVAMERKNE